MDKFYVRANLMSDADIRRPDSDNYTYDVMFGSEVVFYAPNEDAAERCCWELNNAVLSFMEFA